MRNFCSKTCLIISLYRLPMITSHNDKTQNKIVNNLGKKLIKIVIKEYCRYANEKSHYNIGYKFLINSRIRTRK